MRIAKMEDGRIVEIVRIADTVQFSEERGWILICVDFEKVSRKREQVKWIPASTARFVWIREFEG